MYGEHAFIGRCQDVEALLKSEHNPTQSADYEENDRRGTIPSVYQAAELDCHNGKCKSRNTQDSPCPIEGRRSLALG